MRLFTIITLAFVGLFFNACGTNNKVASELFEIKLEGNKTQFQQNENVTVSITNKKNIEIEAVSYAIDDKEISLSDNKINLDMPVLGSKTLKANITYDGKTEAITKEIKILSSKSPEVYSYEIINEYPHDQQAFTQGLEFYKDTLYESTGRKGQSTLRKIDFRTGKIIKQIDLEDTYFGEGITILNDKVYMLTWQSGIGFIYDVHTFDKLDSFKYGSSKEGWGFTNDGKELYKSDGSEKIWLLNPETLAEEGHIETVTNKSIFNKANELEYVDGKIYANVWQKESMMIIHAKSGAIEGVINFGGLKNKVTKHAGLDVLNGVAYNPTRATFFVTGKNWDKLFEVKIIKK
ncbi:glutaminyl-peptide cyclotransferase [Cellulophaga baltica]|uniref:glutaminyl-peptide cyclotransferase n=1 Tax=Cellulophaga TaxID=104264 RepID=UPI001C07C468|nr:MULTISPECIES: glutaminyl-peptide cyclotransferase [Cellulophaga]MBU2996066.1 glutaminyl-peptide cyclotransferase [Cellulophaga baltica]MDO6767461.1 glutaminyl-peptide cyclotransferase [Cellulophaga sp. 1_MG-2023]